MNKGSDIFERTVADIVYMLCDRRLSIRDTEMALDIVKQIVDVASTVDPDRMEKAISVRLDCLHLNGR